MTAIETIVRPFVAVATGPSVRPFPVPKSTQDEAEATFGGAGGKTVSWTWDSDLKVIPSNEERYNEVGRESTKVKVENPDDAEQFVEFCQAKHVSLAHDKANKPSVPTRTSSFDTSGLLGNGNSPNREYGFEYDKNNTQCKTKKGPDKGCNN